MPKRVSLKGKGAAIFFGDYDPVEPPSLTPPDPTLIRETPQEAPAPIGQIIDHPPAEQAEPSVPPTSRPAAPPDGRTPARSPNPVAMSTGVRVPGRPIGPPPARRTITRYAFEFFQDQVETLRDLALEQKMAGEKGSMSEMVREAIDLYLARKQSRSR